MSMFLPNTTVSIYRTLSAANEYGEFSDDNTTLAASGVPAAVQEGFSSGQTMSQQRASRAATGRETIVEPFTIRLRPDAQVAEGDRIRDERTELWFQVVDVIRPYSVFGSADVRIGAVRVSGASQAVNA